MSKNLSSKRLTRRQRCASVLTKERLEHDFLVLGLTRGQVAEKYGCGKRTVVRYLEKHGIVISRSLQTCSAHVKELFLSGAQLTERQRSIIVGALLGDAYINKRSSARNAMITFWQNGIGRREYLEWIRCELSPFTKEIRGASQSDQAYCLDTVRYPVFTPYHDMFWPVDRKIVPENIADYLDVLALAVWYMDDGCTSGSFSVLSTCCFTLAEHDLLISALRSNFGLEAKTLQLYSKQQGKAYPVTRFNVQAHRELHHIIDPLLLPCFNYKKIRSGASETIREAPSIGDEEIVRTSMAT